MEVGVGVGVGALILAFLLPDLDIEKKELTEK